MILPYVLAQTSRTALIYTLDQWLERPDLFQLEVIRKTGKSKNAIGTLAIDELAILQEGAAVIDEIVERWGQQGGRFEIRATFQPESGPGTGGADRQQLHRSFELQKSRAEQRGKSEGSSAGIEQLTQSFGAAFDAQGQQLSNSVQQQTQLMGIMLDRTEKHHSVHVQEITEYQRLIMEQQLELTEARIELAYRERDPLLTPEHLAMMLPAVVQFLTAVTSKLSGVDLGAALTGAAVNSAAVEGAAAAVEGAAEIPV